MSAPEPIPTAHAPFAPPASEAPADASERVGDLVAPPFWDHAFAGVLFANAMTLAGAIFEHWNATPILWIYWGQSVVIGLANVIRMLSLKEFSTEGFTSGGRQVPETPQSKVSTAMFFALHYGFFHLGYALFLAGRGRMSGVSRLALLGNVLVFAVAHALPLIRGRGNDLAQKRPNLGTLMFYPYLRIIPMHLTIIFGSMLPQAALPLFVGLKTLADLGMHAIERKIFRTPA